MIRNSQFTFEIISFFSASLLVLLFTSLCRASKSQEKIDLPSPLLLRSIPSTNLSASNLTETDLPFFGLPENRNITNNDSYSFAISSWLSRLRDSVTSTLLYPIYGSEDDNSYRSIANNEKHKAIKAILLARGRSLKFHSLNFLDYDADIRDFVRNHDISEMPEDFIVKKLYEQLLLSKNDHTFNKINNADDNTVENTNHNVIKKKKVIWPEGLHSFWKPGNISHPDYAMWDSQTKLSVAAGNWSFKPLDYNQSAEIRSLALKKWLKSSPSEEHEPPSIQDLSYTILSQTNEEEESEDETNDIEILQAVIASIAAYQIRVFNREMRQ